MKKILAAICLILFASAIVFGQEAVIQDDLALRYVVQVPAVKSSHTPVIILLHGYGSNERDLFEIRDILPKNFLVISARAPYELAGGGYEWYEGIKVNGLQDGNKEQLDNSRQLIEQLITQVVSKYKADAKQVYLIGFSQGAIMSYQVGLTAPGKVKGICALSGMIFESLKPLVKNTASLKQLKIFISHGTADGRIPFADGKAADDYLRGLGLNPAFHQYTGMRHAISKNVLNDLLKWLK